MLGDLARNLRIFGYDTLYVGEIERTADTGSFEPLPDVVILQLAKDEGRLILTKDEPFAERDPENVVLVGGTTVPEYFSCLKEKLALSFTFDEAASRCSKCNEPIVHVPKSSIKGRVKEQTYRAFQDFYECPACKQVYWMGAHFSEDAHGLLAKFGDVIEK
jgi:hypothetical protein